MIIEYIFVRKEPVCPGPDDMEMLGFIGVPGLIRGVEQPQREQNEE